MHLSGSAQHTAGMCCESRIHYTAEYCLVLQYLLALARSASLLSTSALQLGRHRLIGDATQNVQVGVTGNQSAGYSIVITHRKNFAFDRCNMCECCSYHRPAPLV